jgi:5-methylcytosine-specific restriction endonuclease McrA
MKRSSGLRRRTPLRRSPPARRRQPKQKVGSAPPELRAIVWERESYRCASCGCWLAAGWHCHHRKLRSQGGRHELPNLLALCAACHGWAHENPADAQARGLIVPSWAIPAVRAVFCHDGRLVALGDDGGYDLVIGEDAWAA